jgi:hypothetical protein
VKNGDIDWTYSVPFGSAVSSSVAGGMRLSVGAGMRLVHPDAIEDGAPFADLSAFAPAASRGSGGPIDYAGKIGGYDVKLHFSADATAGLVVDATAKKSDGSLAIKALGHLRRLDDSADILIQNSHLYNFKYRQGDLTGDLNLEWHAFTSSTGASTLMDDMAFKIPVSFTVPFMVGYIPVTLSVKANLSVSPAIDDNRGSSAGSIKVEYNSTAAITGNGSSALASGTLGSARFEISGETVTAGYVPTGLGMDVEFPRVELTILGTVTTFVSLLAHAYGFYTPGTTLSADIKPCQKAGASLKGYAGVSLSFLGIPIKVGVKELFKSQQYVKYKDGKKCD